MWGELLLVSVGGPVCETAMKVEWDSKADLAKVVRVCNMGVVMIFFVKYRDLVNCESETL